MTTETRTQLQIELDDLREKVSAIRRIQPQARTAEHWRIIARESSVRSAESYERCDTDGFLSQWASDQMNLRYQQFARYAEEGYTTTTEAVFDLQGNLVTMDLRDGDYGPYWFIKENEGRARFFNESEANKLATRRRNNEKKGYRLGSVRVRVEVSEFDSKLTDEIVAVESTDTYGDWIEAGRTTMWD